MSLGITLLKLMNTIFYKDNLSPNHTNWLKLTFTLVWSFERYLPPFTSGFTLNVPKFTLTFKALFLCLKCYFKNATSS